jgi:glutamate carboxypeptidase
MKRKTQSNIPFAACALAVLALYGSHAYAAEADPTLLRAARAQEADVIQTLHDMVAIDSGSDDVPGLQRMADYVERRLRALGAQTGRIVPEPDGAPMVRGSFKGDGRLRAMLIAHMDTVYARGIRDTEPYRRDGNRLYGPGIADDKGGIAVILHALQILRDAGWKDYAQVTVLFNHDEEIGSRASGETIATLGSEHDVVLSFEPSPAKAIAQAEGVLLGAAGATRAVMTVQGRASHAGSAPQEGRNALIELAYQLQKTADISKDMKDAQLNWTTAEAGPKRNQIPAVASAGADVRILSDEAGERLRKTLEAKVAEGRLVPDTTTRVEFERGRPPFIAGPRGQALAQMAKEIYAELDDRPLLFLPSTFGGTDAGFAGRSGKPAVLESLGLAGWGYHAKDEYIEIDSIVPRVYLAARMLQRLADAPPRSDAGS